LERTDDVARLLTEIRDATREHLAEYRRVTERSLALQEKAVARQEQVSRLYVGVLFASGILILGLLGLLAWLLGWL
jgi:hypothetical protein